MIFGGSTGHNGWVVGVIGTVGVAVAPCLSGGFVMLAAVGVGGKACAVFEVVDVAASRNFNWAAVSAGESFATSCCIVAKNDVSAFFDGCDIDDVIFGQSTETIRVMSSLDESVNF